MKAVIVGASGYSGGELLRLLDLHPGFSVIAAIAHSQAGESISGVHPHLTGKYPGNFTSINSEILSEADVIFFALPHGESGRLIVEHWNALSTKKIIDLGADFRLSSPSQWEKYYGGEHHGVWEYGLPELPGARQRISQESHIANPGCYATALALSIAPFAQVSGKANFEDIVITAASGTSGAGRSAKVNLIGSEVMNSLSAYKVGGIHQHTPEIEAAIEGLTGGKVRLSFTPFLAPMPRGILASVSIPISGLSSSQLRELFAASYQNEEFVHLLPEGQSPQTNSLIGSNGVHLQVALDDHVERAIVLAAIDNLGKGAAGQAIQNANLIAGFDEGMGLSAVGVR